MIKKRLSKESITYKELSNKYALHHLNLEVLEQKFKDKCKRLLFKESELN